MSILKQARYEELISIAQQIRYHRQRLAKPRIERLVRSSIDAETPNTDLISHLIAESLLRRIDRNLLESKNIYVQNYDVPQLVMFYRLSQAIPFIGASHSVANQYLAPAMCGHDEATVLDIGIGQGAQMAHLLGKLAQMEGRPKRVHVVGVDPGSGSLARVRGIVARKAERTPFDVEFHAFPGLIEQFDEATYRRIQRIAHNGPLVITSAYTLHHTLHEPGDRSLRTQILERLHALGPVRLVLVEPHSDHDTENLAARLHNAWSHFGAVFDLIDASSLDPASRFAIKEKFFGRELRDIFGVSDVFRCERHEPYESWLLRLARAGFEPVEDSEVVCGLPSHCFSQISEGLVRMGFQDTVVVAVMASQPRRSS